MSEIVIPPPCLSFLGCEILTFEGGRAEVRFRPTHDMLNPFGIVQGGLLAGVLDNVIGPALWSVAPGRPNSTIQLSLNYLAPIRPGDVVLASAEVVRAGRTQAVIDAKLTSEADGTLYARATATNVFLGHGRPAVM